MVGDKFVAVLEEIARLFASVVEELRAANNRRDDRDELRAAKQPFIVSGKFTPEEIDAYDVKTLSKIMASLARLAEPGWVGADHVRGG